MLSAIYDKGRDDADKEALARLTTAVELLRRIDADCREWRDQCITTENLEELRAFLRTIDEEKK